MPEPAPPKPPGRILAFYSYKGGTGRSMALANVAWILASHGRKVLVVDWDLEAPGLHRYFAPFLDDPTLETTDGLINFVRAYALAATSTPPEEADPAGLGDAGGSPARPTWDRRRADITRYAVSLRHRFADGRGTLDFVGAGRQDASYASQVHSFDWGNFFARLGGGDFLEAVRRQMREDYDYVLIDSRTGVSDTAGVCTVVMPDALVVCFTANNQSIEGAAGVAASVLAQWRVDPRRRGQPLEIYPMMARVDDFERDRLKRRQELARRQFGPFLEFLPPTRREDYWGEVEMPYKAFYAYEEILAVFGDDPKRKTTLLASLERLDALSDRARRAHSDREPGLPPGRGHPARGPGPVRLPVRISGRPGRRGGAAGDPGRRRAGAVALSRLPLVPRRGPPRRPRTGRTARGRRGHHLDRRAGRGRRPVLGRGDVACPGGQRHVPDHHGTAGVVGPAGVRDRVGVRAAGWRRAGDRSE